MDNDAVFGLLEYDVPEDVTPVVKEMRRTQAMQRKTYLIQLEQNGKLKKHQAQIMMTWALLLTMVAFLMSGCLM